MINKKRWEEGQSGDGKVLDLSDAEITAVDEILDALALEDEFELGDDDVAIIFSLGLC